MSALDCVQRLLKTNIYDDKDLRFCLVNENKNPFRLDGSRAASNRKEDFVKFEDLSTVDLTKWNGLGISIQFSNICGIDVDHCFSSALDFSSADDRAKDIYDLFKDFAYIEYSFSGKGMRVLFRAPSILDYRNKYLIKNSDKNVEYYQPFYGDGGVSYRYLTITGNTICNNPIIEIDKSSQISILNKFLNKYMKRAKIAFKSNNNLPINDDRDLEQLQKIIKHYLLVDFDFQNNWFLNAPGSNSNESERDYWVCKFIYDNITRDPKKIISLFELSPFYQSKDWYHRHKWNNNEHNYFKYIYSKLSRER